MRSTSTRAGRLLTPGPTSGLRWLALVGIAVLGVGCSSPERQGDRAPAEQLKVGDIAPAFALTASDGDEISLDESLGKRPLLLYFSMGPG